jgi:hypothetical protein
MLLIIIVLGSVMIIPVSSDEDVTWWNENWSYRQEIGIPISTDNQYAVFQPIDKQFEFQSPCWAKDESEHSIRVCCWDGFAWHELESQIYSLNYSDTAHLTSCRIIFLIPEFANGKERYFVYYNNKETPSPMYQDHLSIKDAYYYYEPISGISVEGDYYKILEDNYLVYAIGQKGHVINRRLSQGIIKMKPGCKEFDIIGSELLASFAFAYQEGKDDSDEVSSDQKLISKEVLIDGNLMIQFGIISESSNQHLRTTNIYRYYYSPTEKKRISVDVTHEVLEDSYVKGIVNVDGRFGALISFNSKSIAIKKMVFGSILPYLHIYEKNNRINEYKMQLNPQSDEREWIISYEDNCDLGEEAWISYDEGEDGKCHAIIFSSNKVLKQAEGQRDGIEIKVAQREYLNIVGTEVDYASIAFGRNAYEPGVGHDLKIPKGLIIQFTAEFFTIEQGSYEDVEKESKIFKELLKDRQHLEEDVFSDKQYIHTLTVITHITGRIASYPFLVNQFGLDLPVIWADLYQNDTLIASGMTTKPFVGFNAVKFPKLAPGEYIVKIYRRMKNLEKYIGFGTVVIDRDTSLHIYCTWQRNIEISVIDQNKQLIKDVKFAVFKDDTIIQQNQTSANDSLILDVPFGLFDPYTLRGGTGTWIELLNAPFNLSKPYILKGLYKGFNVFQEELPAFKNTINIGIDLYDLRVDVKDKLDLYPGVSVHPILTSTDMEELTEILPDETIGRGEYMFNNLPAAKYNITVSYGSFLDKTTIQLPQEGNAITMDFSANYKLMPIILNSWGETINDDQLRIKIFRAGQQVRSMVVGEDVSLPPGDYTINIYSGQELIGSKNVVLTNDRVINVVTTIDSPLPAITTGIIIAILLELIILMVAKKISLNSFLKLTAMALIVASLFYPWWGLNATTDDLSAGKTSTMFILPRTMIETVTQNGKISLDIATIPEIFTDFLGWLILIVISGVVLIGISFLPNILLRRRFSLILVTASIIFITLVSAAFIYGMTFLCELSLGSLQGEGVLDITLPNGQTAYMMGYWGLDLGFYLCVISTAILIIAGILDFLRGKHIIEFPK